MNVASFFKKVWIFFVGLFVIAAVVSSIYFYNKYRSAQSALQNPTAYAQQEAKLLKEKVGKLIELPLDEEPTIATVTDADRLRPQPFFANAQNGDRVLIFTQARKAILYRPSTNKIIEVAPVNIGNNQATPSGNLGTGPSKSSVQAPSGDLKTSATPSATPVATGQPTPFFPFGQISSTPTPTPTP